MSNNSQQTKISFLTDENKTKTLNVFSKQTFTLTKCKRILSLKYKEKAEQIKDLVIIDNPITLVN